MTSYAILFLFVFLCRVGYLIRCADFEFGIRLLFMCRIRVIGVTIHPKKAHSTIF